MAHIHLPDGSFTLSWVLFWWACALVIVGGCLLLARRRAGDRKKITVAAFVTAAAFATFLVEVPVLGGVHLNLTPFIGILVGPALGGLVVFVVNLLSAAIGHGGWGLVGANILVNFSEVMTGWLIYRGLCRVTPGMFARAGVATFGGLFVGGLAELAIILISGVQGVAQTGSQLLPGLSLIAGVNLVAAVVEALVTGFLVEYIGRVRPGLLDSG